MGPSFLLKAIKAINAALALIHCMKLQLSVQLVNSDLGKVSPFRLKNLAGGDFQDGKSSGNVRGECHLQAGKSLGKAEPGKRGGMELPATRSTHCTSTTTSAT